MASAHDEEITYLRKKPVSSSQLKSERAVNAAQRSGVEIATSKKFAGGQNKQHRADANTAVLDRETEELKHDTLGLDVGRLIQQVRQEKKMTQKELATKINEKPQIVTDYETGKAIPNQAILNKLERALGTKLRGKDRGKPLTFGKKK